MTGPEPPITVNGWSIYAHPVFLDQLDGLIAQVETRRRKDPKTWRNKNCTKRLAAIYRLVTQVIPSDPTSEAFRQGKTLGEANKHWFRAKFFQQYRLFFRFDSASRAIVLAWVNDETTLRAYGSRTDAYATFKGTLDHGNPPGDFETLLKEAVASKERFAGALEMNSGNNPS